MPKFNPGDVCLLVADAQNTFLKLDRFRGTEVVLVKFLGLPLNDIYKGRDWWTIQGSDGTVFCARERVLEKKKPPKEQVGSWDMIKIQTGNSTGYVPPSRVKEHAQRVPEIQHAIQAKQTPVSARS